MNQKLIKKGNLEEIRKYRTENMVRCKISSLLFKNTQTLDKFEFNFFHFTSSSSSSVKIYQVFSSSENKVIDLP